MGQWNGKKGKLWKQGPLTWGCSISSWFSEREQLAYDWPLQHPSQLSPGCHPVGYAQQRQAGCNVSSGLAETMVLLPCCRWRKNLSNAFQSQREMPFGLPAVSAFLHGPPLLGKMLENKKAGEAGVRTGKGTSSGWQVLVGRRAGPSIW